MKKFAVVLAGCGVYDGAEIHEAVLTLYAIAREGGEYQCFAPDIQQHHVVNHMSSEVVPETRNVLTESARIARGKIRPLSEFNPREFDALIFPGGFGVAKNLCSYAFEGADCSVNPDISRVIREMVSLQKPIGAMCISPVILARVLGNANITIGDDAGTIRDVEQMGATHQVTTHGQVIIDSKHKIATTPCYMLDAGIMEIADGTGNLIREIMKLTAT
jgi:enhancing lycopene biosynthesis protein 2